MTARWLGAAVAVVLLAGCARGDGATMPPRVVADGLVPAELDTMGLAFHETAVQEARQAFTEAGENSLASDGRLWEMRVGDRLVGVLQLTALEHAVDLQDESDRDSIVRQLLPTSRDRFDVGDVTIWSTVTQGKTIYLWFGHGMFSLFTIKPASEDQFDPEAVLGMVLDHMVAADGWEYEYFEAEPA